VDKLKYQFLSGAMKSNMSSIHDVITLINDYSSHSYH